MNTIASCCNSVQMNVVDLAGYQSEKGSINRFALSDLTKQILTSAPSAKDELFDEFLPEIFKKVASIHWTPIEAIRIIAEYLKDLDDDSSFIDIGSGCGKLCTILSLLVKFKIYGIEQRPELYKIAEKIKTANHLDNVNYYCGNMLEMDWNHFDVYYLYNPFQEHISGLSGMRINHKIPFDKKYYIMYTNEVYRQLCWAKPGKRLITFHGYGGSIPSTWRMVQSRVIGHGDLTMWEKIR